MLKGIVLVAFMAVAAYLAYYYGYAARFNDLATVTINGHAFHVEIADSGSERARGLSGRSALASDGMLFLFEDAAPHRFWMKDMQFSIDILFVKDGKILNLVRAAPETGGESAIYYPAGDAAVKEVLELRAYSAERFSLKRGDSVEIALPKPF